MHRAKQDMLKAHDCRAADDYCRALNEVVQEIALLRLYLLNLIDWPLYFF